MKGFNSLHVKSAVKSHSKIDLDRSHLTTGEFGQIQPLLCEETLPGDKFEISADYFSRMAPLVKPTYGKFSFRTMVGFVPYHQLADDAEAFISGKTLWKSQTPKLRYFTVGEYVSFLTSYCCTTTGASSTNCDFQIIGTNGSNIYYLWSNVGRYYVKVLNSLGYAVPEGVNYNDPLWMSDVYDRRLNAFPLLAFFKLYNDWMSQSQRFNVSPLTSFLEVIKHNGSIFSAYYYNVRLEKSLLRP